MPLESQPTVPKTPPRSGKNAISESASVLNKAFAGVKPESESSHTPLKPGTYRVTKEKVTVGDMQKALKDELDGGILDAVKDYHITVFQPNTSHHNLSQFFEHFPTIYNVTEKRWSGIPPTPPEEKVLYGPFLKLFQLIFKQFGCTDHSRAVLPTHNVKIPHKDGTDTAPDFMIMGRGPNFPPTEDEENGPPKISYRRCVAIIEIKTQKNTNKTKNEIQVATYARQCFIEQQNRRFVYTAILTEVNAELFIFDRAGGMRSTLFDFHENHQTFVRMLLGLYCCNNKEIGFDTSIFWEKRSLENKGTEEKQHKVEGERDEAAPKEQGKVDEIEIGTEDDDEDEKWEGEAKAEDQAKAENQAVDGDESIDVETIAKTIWEARRRKTKEQESIARHYDLFICLKNNWDGKTFGKTLGEKRYQVKCPLFSRDSLRGRGTKCWVVLDPDNKGQTLIIKDSWRTSIRESEAILLAQAIGLDGVGQMVACQEDEADRISRFRKLQPRSIPGFDKLDRTFTRIALEEYGGRLECFKDPSHLLCAFRDAVKGHRNLWNKGILHRDVSLNNILFGKEDALDGNKGILIDLDMAIRIDRVDCLEGTFRTGTLAFQSINVLSSGRLGKCAWPHDYLDDLESSLYCLARICGTYTGPGEMFKDHINFVRWEDTNLDAAAEMKRAYFIEPSRLLTPYFTCLGEMVDSMGRFLYEHTRKKATFAKQQKMRLQEGQELIKIYLPNLKEESKGHYDTFIGYIDEAIQRLAPTPTTDDPTEPSRKRGPVEVDGDYESPQKKGRILGPPEL